MGKSIYLKIIDVICASNETGENQIKMFDYLAKLKQTELVAENREKFMDFCCDKYPQIVNEYLTGDKNGN